MWKLARAECTKIGFKVKEIRRRGGILWSEYKKNQQECTCDVSSKWCWCGALTRIAPSLKKHTFLMYDFHVNFLPAAIAQMEEAGYKWAAWMEDDVVFPAGRRVDELADVALRMSPATVWAGYMKVGGKPRWQSHLLLMSLAAAKAMLAELDACKLEETKNNHAHPHLCGLDTWIRDCQFKTVDNVPIVRVSPTVLGRQRGHPHQYRN